MLFDKFRNQILKSNLVIVCPEGVMILAQVIDIRHYYHRDYPYVQLYYDNGQVQDKVKPFVYTGEFIKCTLPVDYLKG